MVTELVGGETGTYDELRADTVDPAAAVDPGTGHKPFLIWKQMRDENGDLTWIALGVDGTIYTIKPATPIPPPSETGIVEVT